MDSEWARFQAFEHEGRQFRPEDVSGDGNCFYRAAVRSGNFPVIDHAALREAVFLFSVGVGRQCAEQAFQLLHQTSPHSPVLFEDVINGLRRNGSYASNIDMVVLSIQFDCDVFVYSNLNTGIEAWSSKVFVQQHMTDYAISSTCTELHIYHHQYRRPLTSAPLYRLNHFAFLFEVTNCAVRNDNTDKATSICNEQSRLPHTLIQRCEQNADSPAPKTFVQQTLAGFFKPVSVSGKRPRLSVAAPKTQRSVKAKTPSATAQEKHTKNLQVVALWSTLIGIDKEAAAAQDAARLESLRYRLDYQRRRKECEALTVVESVLESIIDSVVQNAQVTITKLPAVVMPSGRPKELTWQTRSLMIAFHLHSDFGAGDYDIFSSIFCHLVKNDTLRDWLRKEKIYKWIGIVRDVTKKDILSFIPEQKRAIFEKGSCEGKVEDKLLRDLQDKADSHASSCKQPQLLINNGMLSVQKSSALAKKNEQVIYVKKSTCRIPDGGSNKKLGPPVRYKDQSEWVTDLIISRFQRGEPMTREEAYAATRARWKDTDNSAFKKMLHDGKHFRTWLTRLLHRIMYSDRSGSIGQKVPSNWVNIARSSAAKIRETAVTLNVDNVFNMDETFIVYYASSERVLVPTGTKRVGNLVPVENAKKGVTLAVTACLLSSQLLPPFIIDSGGFGSTLMHQWKTYTKSTVLFNPTHWMTQYVFVIYLEWILKMFPNQRTLLIVDRSTTHYGKMIDDWLEENHASSSTGKIFVEYILEGMTSIQQVCDICINKPLKAKIKTEYYKFRMECIGELTANELVGTTFSVPREDLVGMIEAAFSDINEKSHKSRWIAEGFAKCGQDPWKEDQRSFEQHLESLEENFVYKHMAEANAQIRLT
jgi:hypothetical protein